MARTILRRCRSGPRSGGIRSRPGEGTPVNTAQGELTIRAADIPYGKRVFALGTRAMADRVPPVKRVSDTTDEQDYPAAAVAPGGEVWITYLE